MNINYPKGLEFLEKYPKTLMLKEAFRLYGLEEIPGNKNNPIILSWAKNLGLDGYVSDSTQAWCGLFMAHLAGVSNKPIPEKPLWALNWQYWGNPSHIPKYGDVLVFKRKLPAGGFAGHVALYLAEDKNYYYVIGGNQSNKVCISRIQKIQDGKPRLVAARNSYKIMPTCCEPIHIDEVSTLPVSKNEA